MSSIYSNVFRNEIKIWDYLAGIYILFRKQEQTVQTQKSKDHEIDSSTPESIELFIEDQTFSPSYDLVLPLLRPPPRSRQQVVSLRAPVELTDGRLGEELNHTTARKPGHL